jgi:hypothetical protein
VKNLIIYISLFLPFPAEVLKESNNVLSEDKMVSILVDIHLTEGFVQSLSIPYDSSRKLYPVLEKEIFEKHEVADSVYLNSLQYYLRDTEKMEGIYERTIDSLTVREKNTNNK